MAKPLDVSKLWIQTHSGRAYFPYAPDPEDILIDDIAHALSMLCRFTGHCKRFYSVAEHSYHVSRLVPPQFALAGLLHDATEAYCNDLPRPLKQGLPEYKKVEELNWMAIAEKFDLPLALPDCVHEADATMVWTERRSLMAPLIPGAPTDWGHGAKEPEVYPDLGLLGMPPNMARGRFYDRFYELTNKVAA